MSRRKIIFIAGLAVILTGIIISLTRAKSKDHSPPGTEVDKKEPVHEIVYQYGIPVDSFDIEEIEIRKNENLSHVLLERGISYSQIDDLAIKSKPIFDVRKIVAGNSFTFFWTLDSVPVVKHLVYKKNVEEYITYTIADSITVVPGKKEVTYEQREVAGIIKSSLWNSLADLNVSPRLTLDLMSIYAWTIDWSGIQKNDNYRVIYEVKMIDGEAIGIHQVLASFFYHRGRERFAFAFEQKGRQEYFDENGQSLRRAFLKAPLDYRKISSKYSNSRFHPILKKYRPHRGIDYAADAGTEVVSIGDGRVVKISYDKSSGNYVKIKHNSVYTSGYMHLQRRPNLNVGDDVKQNQEIGRVGMTGYATGPHLDFRIWQNGELVNPENVESPPVEPVAAEKLSQFNSIAAVYRKQLEVLVLSP